MGYCSDPLNGAQEARRVKDKALTDFRYGHLVTTSSRSPIPPSTAPSARVGPLASGVTGFHDVTGGDGRCVLQGPEHIHRSFAAEAGVPALPMAVRGTRAILRPEHHFPRRGTVDIIVGEAVRPLGTGWAAAVALQRAKRDAVLHLSGEPDVE